MRKRGALLAAVAAAGLTALVLAGSGSAAGGTTMTFKEVTTQFYFADAPPTFPPRPGPRGAGNLLYFTGALYPEGGGERQGTNRGFCLTVSDNHTQVQNPEGPGLGVPTPTPDRPAKSIAQCQQTVQLDNGTIMIEGLFNQLAFEGDCASRPTEQFCSGSTETLAITGGTGAYRSAGGVVKLTQIEYPDVVRMEVRLD